MNKKEVVNAIACAQAIKEICLKRDLGCGSLLSECAGCVFEEDQSDGICVLRDLPWEWELHLCSTPPTIKTRKMVLLEHFSNAELSELGTPKICVNDLFRGLVSECVEDCARCWDAPAPEEYQEEKMG